MIIYSNTYFCSGTELTKQMVLMKKLKITTLILLMVLAMLNLLYTFGYQGETMTQVEFLSRVFGSIGLGLGSLALLIKTS